MTTTIKNPTTKAPQPAGFQTIPTRIRDLRGAQVPPLVVEPIADPNRHLICQSLAELGSKLAEVHRTASEAYLSQGMYAEALPHVETAATFAQGDLEYRMQVGFVRYLCGDDIGAIDAFNTVLASDAQNAEGWFNLGMVLFGQNQFVEAEDCFAHSLAIEPNDAQTWNNRGVCLWQCKQPAQAKACFEKALALDSADEDARFNLANLA
jgi:Flp pilus assembly protein TadD